MDGVMATYENTENPPALTFAELISASNLSAYHSNAESEIRAYIIMSAPEDLKIDAKTIRVTYEHSKKGFDIQAPGPT